MRLTPIFLAALILGSCCNDSAIVGTRTNALDNSAWECSEWISAENAPVITGTVNSREGSRRSADGASWFVSTVQNSGKVVSAKWMTAGLGVYEIYLNGKLVGNDFLKPGYTHPQKTKRSFTYDITEAFDKAAGARNVLSAQITPGWWADKIITTNGSKGMNGKKCAFRSVLELTFEDGTKALLGTNTKDWKAGIAGPVKHAAIFDGEEYDARIPMGWDTPEKLSEPELNTEFTGEILPSEGAEVCIRRDLAMKPVQAYVWSGTTGAKEGEYGIVNKLRSYKDGQVMTIGQGDTLVIDFGQNAAAVPSFEFKAAEGTVITCLPGELVNDGNGAVSRGMDGPEGSVHRENLRTASDCFRAEYTFAGKGWERYMPTRTFFGYRYVSITATAEVKIRSIRSIPVTSITADMETGRISTGNELINKLISNTYWGQLSNYLSVPTDCPQRNERLGWMADTQVFTETGTFFANTDSFFHKWTRDVRDCQTREGGFPGVAPFGMFGSGHSSTMRLGWTDAAVIVPWTVWKQFGDVDIVNENWDAMERFLAHVAETRYEHSAILDECGDYQWADWLSYEPLETQSHRAQTEKDANGKRYPLPDAIQYWNYLGACYWIMDAGMMADMAAASGRDASVYKDMVVDAKKYIREKYLGADGIFTTDILNTMQTPALFALKLGLVEGEAREAMIQRLRENFAAHDGCLQTGFLGTSILMQTLTENGLADVAYDLLFQRKNPSWLYSVDNGATTIWERWNSYTLDKGMASKGMNSFNHYAYGCVCEWIWETAAGIASDPLKPGFKHIIMKPIPDKRLGSVNAEFKSAAGVIKSSWKYEGDNCVWSFTIPQGATATVTLPGSSESKEYEAGSYTVNL